MNLPVPASPSAWQPLTPGGVAAFARASWRRLLLMQFAFALLTAATVVWFVDEAWSPVIQGGINRLPDEGEIRAGRLIWPGHSAQSLADSRFLALGVDLNQTGGVHAPADVQVEFGRQSFFVSSLLGRAEFVYPGDYVISFNRTNLIPWWGAWRPPILWMTFGLVLCSCLVAWSALATLYFLPIWLAAFFANRELNAAGSWKLSGAALMPGALLMMAGILAYGFGALDLVQLAAMLGLHLVVGWTYLILGLLAVPEITSVGIIKQNPFTAPAAEAGAGEPGNGKVGR